jgi:hypothetical protein
MEQPAERDWRDHFVRARDLRTLGRHADLVAAVRQGTLVPVIRGVYRHSSSISTDSVRGADDAFLAKVRATQLLSAEPLIYCGTAAAAVWELPMVGPWPDRVSVLVPAASGGRSNVTLARTSVGHPARGVVRGGLRVTSLARTVVDVARTARFTSAVAMADAALHGQVARAARAHRQPLDLLDARAELAALGVVHGSARCGAVLDFADAAAESPGESVSRVTIRLLDLPAPLLQVPFSDARGQIGVTDFYWRHLGVVGEFDGYGKYVREEFAAGRSVADIVMVEKERENRLRALGLRVVRWGWQDALSLPRLRARLAEGGLR